MRGCGNISVVLDTNVFVAAGFNPHSSSARIIEEIERGDLTVVWNATIRAETRSVVEQIPPLSWARFADLFRAENRYTETIDPATARYVSDRADRKFAALAAATGATLITNDHDLLGERHQADACIVTPDEFFERQR